MEETQRFSMQALVVTLLFNVGLLAVVYFVGGEALRDQALVVFGVGLVLTLALWFVLQQLGKRLIEQAAAKAPAAPPPAPAREASPRLAPPSHASALQMLSILQRKGRLIDFLQEDLSQYQDAQIGAAVRSIHEGCKQALKETVTLEPIFTEDEGSQVTLQPGFDAQAVRLTGNVTGNPPFKGALRHRGWRVVRVDLPERMQADDKDRILAAAEVEVGP